MRAQLQQKPPEADLRPKPVRGVLGDHDPIRGQDKLCPRQVLALHAPVVVHEHPPPPSAEVALRLVPEGGRLEVTRLLLL